MPNMLPYVQITLSGKSINHHYMMFLLNSSQHLTCRSHFKRCAKSKAVNLLHAVSNEMINDTVETHFLYLSIDLTQSQRQISYMPRPGYVGFSFSVISYVYSRFVRCITGCYENMWWREGEGHSCLFSPHQLFIILSAEMIPYDMNFHWMCLPILTENAWYAENQLSAGQRASDPNSQITKHTWRPNWDNWFERDIHIHTALTRLHNIK